MRSMTWMAVLSVAAGESGFMRKFVQCNATLYHIVKMPHKSAFVKSAFVLVQSVQRNVFWRMCRA